MIEISFSVRISDCARFIDNTFMKGSTGTHVSIGQPNHAPLLPKLQPQAPLYTAHPTPPPQRGRELLAYFFGASGKVIRGEKET